MEIRIPGVVWVILIAVLTAGLEPFVGGTHWAVSPLIVATFGLVCKMLDVYGPGARRRETRPDAPTPARAWRVLFG